MKKTIALFLACFLIVGSVFYAVGSAKANELAGDPNYASKFEGKNGLERFVTVVELF